MRPEDRRRLDFRSLGRYSLSALMIFAGTEHFVNTAVFAAIVPHMLPAHAALVRLSGFFEIAGGIGLLYHKTESWAAWGLAALLIAVFPANVAMALSDSPIGGHHYPVLLWLRLPLQIPLIAWAYGYTQRPGASGRSNRNELVKG